MDDGLRLRPCTPLCHQPTASAKPAPARLFSGRTTMQQPSMEGAFAPPLLLNPAISVLVASIPREPLLYVARRIASNVILLFLFRCQFSGSKAFSHRQARSRCLKERRCMIGTSLSIICFSSSLYILCLLAFFSPKPSSCPVVVESLEALLNFWKFR